ncbi:MAG: transcriptional repressor NrdR [Chloroflexi bacterium]|nr:transcriptional repressor NrdR [Chloroflexota bacterium]
MQCPYCEATDDSRVIDTTRDNQGIRRRRECKVCGRRFNTWEKVTNVTPMLVKGNGEREAFDRDKLIRGIHIACAKRPIPAAGITGLVDQIETYLQQLNKDEVSSRIVGDMVVEGLKELDPIAYIRYAIVYLGLNNLTSVRDMLDSLLADQASAAKPQAKAPVQHHPYEPDHDAATGPDGSSQDEETIDPGTSSPDDPSS